MEQWVAIPGFEGKYEASDMGRIRSVKRSLILKPYEINSGYLMVILYGSMGHRFRVLVHRLINRAFAGIAPKSKPQCHHINGNRHDNRLANLEWVSASMNVKDTYERGQRTRNAGEANKKAKLTETAVLDIRARYQRGVVTYRDLAQEHGVSVTIVRKVVQRECWTHI